MTATAFFGYLLLSCGPPLATWLPFISRKSLLCLTALSSLFCWMTVLVFTSALFRAFVPLDSTESAYTVLILVTVLIEECFRYWAYRLHIKAVSVLKDIAARSNAIFTPLDEVSLAYSVGWGQGFIHVLFQFLPYLPTTWNSATAYNSACPQMSLFLVSCLSNLGMFLLLSGLHVVFIDGMKRHRGQAISVPVIHLGVSSLSLSNFSDGGCVGTVPAILVIGVLGSLWGAHIAWHVALEHTPRPLAPLAARTNLPMVGIDAISGQDAASVETFEEQ